MGKTAKKIWNIITTVLVVLVVILALLLVGARIFGLQVFYVMSGSMEPTYHVGSLIYVKKIDPADVKVGDPITYVHVDGDEANGKKTVVTHRVVKIEDEGVKNVKDAGEMHCWRYTTKGDANQTIDGGDGVFSPNLLGKPVFTIPVLGYVAHFVQNPPGMYIAIAAGAVLLLLVFLPDLISGKKKEQAKPEASPAKAAEAASPDTAEPKAAEAANPAPVDKNGE